MDMAGDPRAQRDAGLLLSFDDVQQRLIDAVRVTWRLGDREASWMRGGSAWPQVLRHTWFGDYPDTEAAPKRQPLSRRQMADAEQALGWVMAAGEDDRRLIGLAVRMLAACPSTSAEVQWRRLLVPMGLKRGADGLRMRYGRAMRLVVRRANHGFRV